MESRTYYPLTPSQMAMFFARKYALKKSVVNIPTSMIVHDKLDLDVLEEAALEAIQRWDSFGIRLIKDGQAAKQYFTTPEVESIERLDFTGKSREEMEETFEKLGSKKLEAYDKPMARIYLVTTPEGYGGVFTVISHLILDSWAISSFYKDLMEIYYHKMGKGDYPKDVVPYEEVLKKEVEYRNTPAYGRDRAYWEEEFNTEEPMYTCVNGSEVLEQYRRKRGNEEKRAMGSSFFRNTAGHDLYWVKKEDVDIFKNFIETKQLPSMQVLFQMGYRTYLAKVNNREADISTFNVVARRGTLLEKNTGGTRVHFYDFRTLMDEDTTFIQGCQQLLSKQNELYRHADFDPMEMMDMQKKAYGIKQTEWYQGLNMTFQPVPMTIKENLKVESRWYSNGAVSSMLYITIMDGDGAGSLKCYYTYKANQISAEKIKELHESCVKIMIKGCENPDITLGELFDAF